MCHPSPEPDGTRSLTRTQINVSKSQLLISCRGMHEHDIIWREHHCRLVVSECCGAHAEREGDRRRLWWRPRVGGLAERDRERIMPIGGPPCPSWGKLLGGGPPMPPPPIGGGPPPAMPPLM